MERVVFSLFIDIPVDEVDFSVSSQWSTRNPDHTQQRLIEGHREYASQCNAEYLFFNASTPEFSRFSSIIEGFGAPFTRYEKINFFKLYLLQELAGHYDELLYLDLDVIPLGQISIFDAHDLTQGLHLKQQTEVALRKIARRGGIKTFAGSRSVSKRSTAAKYINCYVMLQESGYMSSHHIWNTGVIAARRESIQELDYFGKHFLDAVKLMTSLINESHPFAKLRQCFAYDNETILSYYLATRNIKYVELDDTYHFICKNKAVIPESTVLVHAIHKDFEDVWRQKYV